jgi:tetratricopeptide (TPR) repeat protein
MAAPHAAAPGRVDRGLVFGLGIGLVALALLFIVSGGLPSTPSSAEPGQAADVGNQIFSGIDRNDVQALMRRAKELYDQSRFEDAATVYQEVVRIKPDNQAAHSNLGSTYFRMQRLDEALASFREAVRLSPNDAEARQNLGAGLAAQGNFDAAIAEYDKAVALKPDLAPAHYSLGVLHQEKGNSAKAIEELKRYLELGTDQDLRTDAERRLQSLGAR